MVRTICGFISCCLLVGQLLGTHADATSWRHPAISLARPVASTDSAQLSGRAHGHDGVVLQKRRHGHWKKVRTLPVRHGRYQTTVALTAREQVFRTRAGRATSRARTVAPRIRSDACGVQPRKATGAYWACTFVDDFDGSALDRSKWFPQEIFAEGNLASAYACYHDDPSLVAVSGGALHLSVRQTALPQACIGSTLPPTVYSAGSVSTYHLFSQQYGRFEARIRSSATDQPGLHEAFWLWPDDREASTVTWPAAGEIDIAETYSNWPSYAVPFLHYTANDNGGLVPGLNTNLYCAAARGAWNTYTLEWSATRIEILVNGQSCLVNTSGDPAFMKKYIVALTQGLGTNTNTLIGATPLPATTDVDYVRVWK